MGGIVCVVVDRLVGHLGREPVSPLQPDEGPNPLLVNVSARHVHVTQDDLEVLYGTGAQLTTLRDLYQAGEFASEQVRHRFPTQLRALASFEGLTLNILR